MGRNSFKKEKTSFNGGQYFHFRCVYLNIAEGKFFCSEINVLILWYSRVRAFPQKRIEGDYLTKKKNNYCWVLPSCSILFFVFQFLCNILTHVLQAKRQKKYVQIPNFFSLHLLRATVPQKHHRPVGLLYGFPQCCKITVWKRLHKSQVNILLQ